MKIKSLSASRKKSMNESMAQTETEEEKKIKGQQKRQEMCPTKQASGEKNVSIFGMIKGRSLQLL